MSNVLNIPQIPAGTAITVAHAEDWRDQISVSAPGAPSGPITLVGSATANGTTFTVPASEGVLPGMLAVGYGVPLGATVTAVTATVITLSVGLTLTAPALTVVFLPPPLDITGVAFTSQIRTAAPSSAILLSASTADGTMTNGGAIGVFGWNVPAAKMAAVRWPSELFQEGSATLYLDVIASDASGAKVSLCAAGPIPILVNLSVTR